MANKTKTVAIKKKFTPSPIEQHFISAGLIGDADHFLKNLKKLLHRSPQPEKAEQHLLRFLETEISSVSILRDLSSYPVLLETIMTIFGSSNYLSEVLIRDTGLFRWLTATDVLNSPPDGTMLRAEAEASLGIFRSIQTKTNALKRLQRREFLRIGVRDLLGLADLETTTRSLSLLSDIIIESICSIVLTELHNKFGAVPETPWLLIGLGKLGGNELNYSSDIDIMALFGDEGEIHLPDNRMLSYGEFFTRFTENLIRLLTENNGAGHFYRVDMRLRPDGKSGPLIRSFAGTMTYYESRGELWERQMLIKARIVAGNAEFGKKFLDALMPFIYPRTFFKNPLDEIARIKSLIESKTKDTDNIKLSPGGIRDIEFIVQALQLLNGGRIPLLRTSSTLAALSLASDHSLLTKKEAAALRDAYLFFRTVEHRLQMEEYAQTHTLSPEPELREALAARCGMTIKKFDRTLAAHRKKVRTMFESVFRQPGKTKKTKVSRIQITAENDSSVEEKCRERGFKKPQDAAKILSRLFFGSNRPGYKNYTEQTRGLFTAIVDPFLNDVCATVDPDRTLMQCEKVISAFPSIDSLLKMLDNPKFRPAFVALCGRSAAAVRILSQRPQLTDLFMTRLGELLYAPIPLPSENSSLRDWKERAEFQAIVRHTLGKAGIAEFLRTLSDTASHAVNSIYHTERKKMHLTHSSLFAVFALGKFGGEEMNVGSDLDLIFIGDTERKNEMLLFERLSSRIIDAISGENPLFAVDARLRPEGKNAPLVILGRSYKEYLRKRASLWERQSLTRARYIAGNNRFGMSMTSTIRNWLYLTPLPAGWQKSIIDMRKKTESRNTSSVNRSIDLKIAPGGMMDIEFYIQALQLFSGTNASSATNMFKLLDRYTDQGIWKEQTMIMRNNYRFLRSVETCIKIGLDMSSNSLPADPDDLEFIARSLNLDDADSLLNTLRTQMKETRKIFNSVLSAL